MTVIHQSVDARGVARVTLTRPEKRNALSAETMDAVSEAAASIGEDASVRVVVLQSEGDVFCAGADLDWMRAQMSASSDQRKKEAYRLASMLGALNDLSKPLVVRVQGDAFGGALGLLSVSDVVIASDNARFGLTETRLGLIPATIAPYLMARLGEGAARRYFFSPHLFEAQEARRIGLVSSVVAPAALDDAVGSEIDCFLNAAPGAVAETKQLIAQLRASKPDQQSVLLSMEALARRWDSEEADEGTRAFFQKRRPKWLPD